MFQALHSRASVATLMAVAFTSGANVAYAGDAPLAPPAIQLSLSTKPTSGSATVDTSHQHDHGSAIRADGHAPIGVMGDHMHDAGEIMLSYRFMRMWMQGNRDGTDELTPEEIVAGYPSTASSLDNLRVVPTQMTMDMHMLGAMYAPTDWMTLMLMGSYQEKDMDHVTFNGAGTARIGVFNTTAKGIGDTKASAMLKLHEDDTHHVHANLGLSFPTGSIDKDDIVLAPNGSQPSLTLPYPMQLGSGTYDLLPGITYTGGAGDIAWGAQYSGVFRTGENKRDYRLGHENRATAWVSYQLEDWASTSFRVAGQRIGKIQGQDSRIAAPVQTAETDNHGGTRIDVLMGVNLAGQSDVARGQRLALEVGMPVYQDLNGPQLETDLTITLGWQYAF